MTHITDEGGKLVDEDRIEALADRILRASGSALRHYSLSRTREEILEATRGAYMAGWQDGYRSARGEG